jgi:hypothetical protein
LTISPEISISDISQILSLIIVGISLVAVARSNRRMSQSMRSSTLQAMITEMNKLRQSRSDNPELERALFSARKEWTDSQIEMHLAAVQLANIFEWAFLARRDGLVELDVWDSWVETWRSVILASEPLKLSFTDSVWTLGRSPEVSHQLTLLVNGTGKIADPLRKKSRLWERLVGV